MAGGRRPPAPARLPPVAVGTSGGRGAADPPAGVLGHDPCAPAGSRRSRGAAEPSYPPPEPGCTRAAAWPRMLLHRAPRPLGLPASASPTGSRSPSTAMRRRHNVTRSMETITSGRAPWSWRASSAFLVPATQHRGQSSSRWCNHWSNKMRLAGVEGICCCWPSCWNPDLKSTMSG